MLCVVLLFPPSLIPASLTAFPPNSHYQSLMHVKLNTCIIINILTSSPHVCRLTHYNSINAFYLAFTSRTHVLPILQLTSIYVTWYSICVKKWKNWLGKKMNAKKLKHLAWGSMRSNFMKRYRPGVTFR